MEHSKEKAIYIRTKKNFIASNSLSINFMYLVNICILSKLKMRISRQKKMMKMVSEVILIVNFY